MTPSKAHTRRLQAIVASSHDAIIGCHLDGRITSWNPAARRLYGYRPDEAIGRQLDLLSDADQVGEMTRILKRLAAGERFERYETVHTRRDGSPIAVAMSISRLDVGLDADDPEAGGEASLIVRDMSARHQAEAELRQAHRELETLIATISHELRSPVFGARELIHLVRREVTQPSADMAAYLGHLETSLTFSDRLLDELSALAGSRQAGRNPQAVKTTRIVEQLVLDLRASQPDRELEIHVAPDLPELWCHVDALRRLLRQLLSNAAQFAGPSPRIEIGWRPAEAPLVTLFVRDDGPGIPRGEQTRIFDMFYRRHGPERQGPGLGLALVKKLSEAMGGRVWLESIVGQGSTFYVALPSLESRGRRSAG